MPLLNNLTYISLVHVFSSGQLNVFRSLWNVRGPALVWAPMCLCVCVCVGMRPQIIARLIESFSGVFTEVNMLISQRLKVVQYAVSLTLFLLFSLSLHTLSFTPPPSLSLFFTLSL